MLDPSPRTRRNAEVYKLLERTGHAYANLQTATDERKMGALRRRKTPAHHAQICDANLNGHTSGRNVLADSLARRDRNKWKGGNLQGELLMRIREELKQASPTSANKKKKVRFADLGAPQDAVELAVPRGKLIAEEGSEGAVSRTGDPSPGAAASSQVGVRESDPQFVGPEVTSDSRQFTVREMRQDAERFAGAVLSQVERQEAEFRRVTWSLLLTSGDSCTTRQGKM